MLTRAQRCTEESLRNTFPVLRPTSLHPNWVVSQNFMIKTRIVIPSKDGCTTKVAVQKHIRRDIKKPGKHIHVLSNKKRKYVQVTKVNFSIHSQTIYFIFI